MERLAYDLKESSEASGVSVCAAKSHKGGKTEGDQDRTTDRGPMRQPKKVCSTWVDEVTKRSLSSAIKATGLGRYRKPRLMTSSKNPACEPDPNVQSTCTDEFTLHVPKSFLSSRLSNQAKLLYLVLRSYANVHTGITWVSPATLERTLKWSKETRLKFTRELTRAGWLSGQRRLEQGQFREILYTLKVDCWPR